MPGNRPSFVNQLTEMWKRLSWAQRITIAISGILGLALVGTMRFWQSENTADFLFADTTESLRFPCPLCPCGEGTWPCRA